MKKINQILLGTAFIAAIALTTSCKKETEPGPSGSNGTDGNVLRYKQEGTTLNLTGIYSSNGAAFNNDYTLSYFASLDENSVLEEEVEVEDVEQEIPSRTSATETTYYYHIVRRDSLNNSVLSFDIVFYAEEEEPFVNNLNIDVITDATSTEYKRISTGYVYDPSISVRTSGGTANGYFERSSLNNNQIYDSENTLAITHWEYDNATKKVSFEFSGTLVDYRNSTKNNLTITAKVAADLRQETHRIGKK